MFDPIIVPNIIVILFPTAALGKTIAPPLPSFTIYSVPYDTVILESVIVDKTLNSSFLFAILTGAPVISILPLAVMSIPPAALEAFKVIAFALASVDSKLIEDPVAVISISSPAAAPEASMSIPPNVDIIVMASVALSVA